MYGNWINLGSFIDSDITFSLSKGEVLSNSISFLLVAYSEKWPQIDLSFEYRLSENDIWRNDAAIDSSSSIYVKGNRLFGISASKNGASNTFRWNYDKNMTQYGREVKVRITILPRSINFSGTELFNIVSETYENNKSDISVMTSKKVVNKDRDGNYIVINGGAVNFYSNVSNASPDFSFNLNGPQYVMQKSDGRYLILDKGGEPYQYGAIYDLDRAYQYKSLAITDAPVTMVFVDFSEENNTILVCKENNCVSEIIWDDAVYSTNTIWKSDSSIISNPVCATYGRKDSNNIVICDSGSSSVYIYNKDSKEYRRISNYKIVNNSSIEQISLMHSPFRAYELEDGNIWISEKDGMGIDFELYQSSSSSSISSSISSSSIERNSTSSGSSNSSFGYSSSSSLSGPIIYTVSPFGWGTPPPEDMLGGYQLYGTCNGQPSYRKKNSNWYIYFDGVSWDIDKDRGGGTCSPITNNYFQNPPWLGGGTTGTYSGIYGGDYYDMSVNVS